MDEEHLWLEKVEGEQALDWVQAQNARTLEDLHANPVHDEFRAAAIEVLTAQDRIPYAAIRHGFAYNFWQDDEHVKGVWRRAALDGYLADDPEWEILLDVDALAAVEETNWVYAGATPWRVDGAPVSRYLIALSIGGRDATTVREFDVETGEFVESGFVSPEAKQNSAWVGADDVLIATDWGDGTTTESGYPLSVRHWKRGTDLADAVERFCGEVTDVGVWPIVLRRADDSLIAGAVRSLTFFTSSYWLFPDLSTDEVIEPLQVPIPQKANIGGVFNDQVIVSLQQDWRPPGQREFFSGDLVSFDLETFLRTATLPEVRLMFRPTARQAVQAVAVTRERVLVGFSDNVVSKLTWLDPNTTPANTTPANTTPDRAPDWVMTPVALPGAGEANVAFSDPRESVVLLTYQDFLTPDSLYRLEAGSEPELVRAGVAHFDVHALTVSQRFAASTDGTDVPYFLVHRADIDPTGATPTLLYGYGGFEISMTPTYSPTIGRLWLERGGAFALANIRGGGEFGPAWHQAGLKQKRQIVYDDFIAIATDLIDSGVTSRRRLGIMGGSNGGLLMGVMLTQRPDLWRAVVLQVPLLDMLRYHVLLAGASWIDEYGSPEVAEERAFLETLSPYHRFDAEVDYPTPFFVTSTKDDRVHPAHARKLAKRFEEAGKPFLYFENTDGGHGAATTQIERAERVALEYTYLTERLFG